MRGFMPDVVSPYNNVVITFLPHGANSEGRYGSSFAIKCKRVRRLLSFFSNERMCERLWRSLPALKWSFGKRTVKRRVVVASGARS